MRKGRIWVSWCLSLQGEERGIAAGVRTSAEHRLLRLVVSDWITSGEAGIAWRPWLEEEDDKLPQQMDVLNF